jgi:hypothetical protein
MAGPQRIEWRRRRPQRALSNLGWYGAVAVLGVACVWLLFGHEPQELDTGVANPLAVVPAVVTVLAVLGAAVLLLPVARRPVVAADHYALLVRAGVGRTLALPWVRISEIAMIVVKHERYLLVRCRAAVDLPGERPGWWEQGPLRRLATAGAPCDVTRYDLAVPMRDFVGGVQAQMTALAAFAPDTVAFADQAHWEA